MARWLAGSQARSAASLPRCLADCAYPKSAIYHEFKINFEILLFRKIFWFIYIVFFFFKDLTPVEQLFAIHIKELMVKINSENIFDSFL